MDSSSPAQQQRQAPRSLMVQVGLIIIGPFQEATVIVISVQQDPGTGMVYSELIIEQIKTFTTQSQEVSYCFKWATGIIGNLINKQSVGLTSDPLT